MKGVRGGSALGVAVASIGLLIACGSGDDDSPGPGGSGGTNGITSITVSNECQAFAEARCERERTCAPYRFGRAYLDTTVCETGFGQICQNRMEAPGSAMTESSVTTCAEDFAALSCERYMNYDYPDSCEFHGSRADGEPCGTDAQCESSYCVLDNEDWRFVDYRDIGCGHCQPTPPRDGEDCDWAGDRICYPRLSTRCGGDSKCYSLQAEGETCGGNDCFGTGLCSNGSGTCIAQFGEGETCLQTAEASLHGDLGCNFDVLGLMCNRDPFVCEPGPTLAGEGDDCDPLQPPCGITKICVSTPMTCGMDLECDGQIEKCVPYSDLGGTCDDLFDCLWPYTCRDGTCKLFDASSCR